MLKTIMQFEIKRWLKSWQFYLYFFVFFFLAFATMAASSGYFDTFSTTTSSNTVVNSSIAITRLMQGMSMFVLFIIPTIIGSTVYRDFSTRMHTLLYAYPLDKHSYLAAKFFSGFIVVALITLSIVLGFLLAHLLPFYNDTLLTSIRLSNYLQGYFLLVLPNIFFIGTTTFMLVTLTRNAYAGFIFVIILLFVPSLISSLSSNTEDTFSIALLDPIGAEALRYVTKYWTIDEQNTLLIPLDRVILLNRAIWMGVGILFLAITYICFSFSQSPLFIFKAKQSQPQKTKTIIESPTIKLPQVSYSYSFYSNFKTAIRLSKFEFLTILKNKLFLILLLFLMLVLFLSSLGLGKILGTNTYPVTWQVIEMVSDNIGLFLSILIYLFAGILLNRGKQFNAQLLIDATSTPNWSLLLSKFIALVQMVVLILLIGIVSGIIIQAYHSYYQFDIQQYLTEFFGFQLINYIIIIFFALFIQSLFRNYFIGFFVILLALEILPIALVKFGVSSSVFYFNDDPGYSYSDMNGYGAFRSYFYHKIYWLLFGFFLYTLTLLLWRRGILSGVAERCSLSLQRCSKSTILPMSLSLIGFLAMGFAIYTEENASGANYTAQELEQQSADYEKQYKKFEHYAQPRIIDVKVDMNIYPYERNYNATVRYIMLNKSKQPIDSLFLQYNSHLKTITFNKANKTVLHDTIMEFNIYHLQQPLMPGDSLEVEMQVENEPNTWLNDHSPILENGTFINNTIFPSFGYDSHIELSDNEVRKKYHLPEKDLMAAPTDSMARQNTYISNEADWINFETTVSTAEDQIAIAPGYLQKQWKANGRNYFHYKMDQKMLNFYAFNSARFEIKKEKWNGINIEIYYHKGHEYNLNRMMTSMKKAIEYYSKNFSPYQHKQARIIEFPKTMGTFAQSFANTIPFSEAIGFIAKVEENNPNAVDYPFAVVAHEIAHQWWAHQVIGANTQGSTLLSESASEYSALKVLEKEYGKFQMRHFLKDALDKYLIGRSMEWKKENPLMFTENQPYIHYNKGSLVLYAMSDYIGEEKFNQLLKHFIEKVKYQEPPYTTSIEFIELLKTHTPDSLQYLINDMFETITLYDNKIDEVKVTPLPQGKYKVDISFTVAKYKNTAAGEEIFTDDNGKTLKATINKKSINSYPLQDYIEVGIFGTRIKKKGYEYENELYNKKYLITGIKNKVSIITQQKPMEVGIDPYNKLIDRNANDNRQKVK